MKRILAFGFVASVCLTAFASLSIGSVPPVSMQPIALKDFSKRPKLVVVLVIDQFRADYLTRFEKRFLPASGKGGDVGGFAYLMSKGAYFSNAQYDVLQCMTGPGHAMILSGAYPYTMGISLNDWYDAKLGKSVYCTDDADSQLVGPARPQETGMSPKNFVGTTVGDELKNAGYASRVVTVALKDRAAILLGGHRADMALWMSDSFQWITSRHYIKQGDLPDWVKTLNLELEKRKGTAQIWETKDAETGNSNAFDKGPWKRESAFGSRNSLSTPVGLEITTDAAIAAVNSYHLGRNESSDLLAVSYSSHDFLGHAAGANSREMEEMTVAEDRTIARLLNSLRKSRPGGLKDVTLVLTADHGVSPAVPYLKPRGVDAGYLDGEVLVAKLDKALSAKYGKITEGASWISALISFNFYLNQQVLDEKKLATADVEAEVKRFLIEIPGVQFVMTRTEYAAGRLPPGMFERQIKKTFQPSRNGNVVLIPKPFYMESGPFVTHMTGYAYDRSVPLILVGERFKPGVYASAADVIDLAPTLSFILGVLPPALSEGRVLTESLR